jgi:hypothetical protein
MRCRATAGVLALVALSGVGHAQPTPRPASRLADVDQVRSRLGLTAEYTGTVAVEALKVAILDYGFAGVGPDEGYLPSNTVVVENYDPDFVRRYRLGDPNLRKPFEPGNIHGRVMAQIVWAVTGGHPRGPRFYLLNASGPTMLRRAVRFAIDQKVDLILFCGSFEGGGNGDGRGPINGVVAQAVAAGILWVNAAGNYGGKVYEGPVRVLGDGYLKLREGSDVASLRFRNHLDENTVTISLTWNDYREEEDAGTDKDLDLYVEDPSGRQLGVGNKLQVSGPGPTRAGESRNPRERVVLENLPARPVVADRDFAYRVRVVRKRGSFGPSDRLRILITARRESYWPPGDNGPREAVEFLDATRTCELFPPADNPLVLTVGDDAPTSSVGPTTDRRVKPDVLIRDSRAHFTNGEVVSGSSTAAAIVAGSVLLLKAAAPGLDPSALLRVARQGPIVAAPPAPHSATNATDVPSLWLNLWQPPTRARLAELVRTPK